jgi:general secretion pathway protein K
MHILSQRLRQRGVALITALLIVALATTAAAWLTNTHQLSIRRTGNVINGDQAYEYALGLEMLTIISLNADLKESNKTDGFSDLWAVEIPALPVEGGEVKGRVIDLQGLFNLNSLYKNGNVDVKAVERFHKLLLYMQMDPLVTDAVIDWMDTDVVPKGTYGAEDDYYAGLDRPYRPANAPFSSVSELRMVKGFDVKQFELLSSVLIALPGSTNINVNTAPREIHIALGVADESLAEMLDQNPDKEEKEERTEEDTAKPEGQLEQAMKREREQAQARERQREQDKQTKMIAEFESLDDYIKVAGLKSEDKKDLTVKSSYFLFEGEARIDRGYCLLKTILYRDNSGNIRVVMRTQGTL